MKKMLCVAVHVTSRCQMLLYSAHYRGPVNFFWFVTRPFDPCIFYFFPSKSHVIYPLFLKIRISLEQRLHTPVICLSPCVLCNNLLVKHTCSLSSYTFFTLQEHICLKVVQKYNETGIITFSFCYSCGLFGNSVWEGNQV